MSRQEPVYDGQGRIVGYKEVPGESDSIHNPAHYTAYPVQPIEIARHLGFCMGNVFKYVMLSPFKNGVEDLKKALKYLEWEREQHETTRFQHSLDKKAFSDFIDSVGYVPGEPDSNIAFSVRTDILPEPYALDIVNFLHEMFMYLFVREDYASSGLIGMESDICNIVDTMENNTPGFAFRERNPVREEALEAVKNNLNKAKEHAMNLKPLFDRVLVKRFESEEKTAGGLFIPDNAKEKPVKGIVVAIGSGINADGGKVSPPSVKAGDFVLFNKYAGTELHLNGVEHLVMRESDILGIIIED